MKALTNKAPMSNPKTNEMIKLLIDRIGDFTNDPEPQHDAFLEAIPVHTRQQLKHALLESYSLYKKEISQG